jgi:hypothetical protein
LVDREGPTWALPFYFEGGKEMILTIAKIIIAVFVLIFVYCLGFYNGSTNEHERLLKALDEFQKGTLKMVQDFEKVQKEKEEKDETVS